VGDGFIFFFGGLEFKAVFNFLPGEIKSALAMDLNFFLELIPGFSEGFCGFGPVFFAFFFSVNITLQQDLSPFGRFLYKGEGWFCQYQKTGKEFTSCLFL
jgi:hypothetical protein